MGSAEKSFRIVTLSVSIYLSSIFVNFRDFFQNSSCAVCKQGLLIITVLKRSNYAMNLPIWVLTLQFDFCHQTSIQCCHQFLQLGQYEARWVRDCKFRKGAWLLSVKSRGQLGFERAKWIRAIWRWWDTWVQEDSSFWESREKTGYTFMKVREKRERHEKRKGKSCTALQDLVLRALWGFE